MTKKLMELTPEQTAAMGPYADKWIRERGWRTTPLTDAEWATFEQGVHDCYRFAGLEPPKVIVRVPNPLVGALAAPAHGGLLLAEGTFEVRRQAELGRMVHD